MKRHPEPSARQDRHQPQSSQQLSPLYPLAVGILSLVAGSVLTALFYQVLRNLSAAAMTGFALSTAAAILILSRPAASRPRVTAQPPIDATNASLPTVMADFDAARIPVDITGNSMGIRFHVGDRVLLMHQYLEVVGTLEYDPEHHAWFARPDWSTLHVPALDRTIQSETISGT